MKIEIEKSPYGDEGATYEGVLGMMNHFRLQLISFRSPKKTKAESEYLEADIKGYEEILKSGSEKNAQLFLEHKRDAITHQDRFENNLKVIEHLKSEGLWVNPK